MTHTHVWAGGPATCACGAKESEASFEARWRAAGYTEWPPAWRDIIPKLTDSQITDLLDKMPKMGKTFK